MRLRKGCSSESPASERVGELSVLGSGIGLGYWVEDFHCCGEHFPVLNPNFLGTKCPASSVLRQQLEVGINAPLEKKPETGECYQLLRSPVPIVGRSPHPEFECCQNYPVLLTEATVEVVEIGKEMETGVGMAAGSDEDLVKPQRFPV
jgi:hypothetical protein